MKTFFYDGKNKQGLFDLIKSLSQENLWRFRIDEYSVKTRDQEKKYHAMLNDIADQSKHLNQHFKMITWKRLCVDMFAKDAIENNVDKVADYFKRNPYTLIPSLDGKGLILDGEQTRVFPRYVAAAFIEWLYAFGADRDVIWSERFINE